MTSHDARHVAVEARLQGEVEADWLNMAALLLQHGAPVAEGDGAGLTAFEMAAVAGDEQMLSCFEGGFASIDPTEAAEEEEE